jgi:hypothetical protein
MENFERPHIYFNIYNLLYYRFIFSFASKVSFLGEITPPQPKIGQAVNTFTA